MPRRKIPMKLIENRRTRDVTCARRKDGIMKKARELATLCDVPVAVVCFGPDGGAPDVWASEEGVLDRYRALPPEMRAEHTHLNYLKVQLGKEQSKLARVQQDGPAALDPSDPALDKMTPDELQKVLETIDAALQATSERRKALGLPDDADDAGESLGHGVPCTGRNFVDSDVYQMQAPSSGNINNDQLNEFMRDAYLRSNADVMQHGYNAQYMGGDGVHGYQLQMPGNGSNDDYGRLYQPCNAVVQHGYNAQYMGGNGVHVDDYQLQMPGNGNNNDIGQLALGAYQPRNAVGQHGYGGFQCADRSYVDMDGYQMPVLDNGNVDNGWLNLAMLGTNEPCNLMNVDCYETQCSANEFQCSSIIQNSSSLAQLHCFPGDSFVDTPAGFPGMGTGGNFMNVDGYKTQCSANEFQCSDTSQNSSSLDKLHYLSDVAEGLQIWEK